MLSSRAVWIVILWLAFPSIILCNSIDSFRSLDNELLEKDLTTWYMSLVHIAPGYPMIDLAKTILSFEMFYNPQTYSRLLLVPDVSKLEDAKTHFASLRVATPVFYPLVKTSREIELGKTIQNLVRMRSPDYHLQQYYTFFLDVYANKKARSLKEAPPDIIAFGDIDSQMMTVMPTGEFLRDGKLSAFLFGSSIFEVATQKMLKLQSPGNAMAKFPIFFWRTTLSNFRAYMIDLYDVSTFVEAFELAVKGTTKENYFSQFCLIMTYAFHYEHNLYDWFFYDLETRQYAGQLVPQTQYHLKESWNPSVMKGCCLSYKMYMHGEALRLCSQYLPKDHAEVYRMSFQHPTPPEGIPLLGDFYKRVNETVALFSDEDRERKVRVCEKFVLESNKDIWFPHSIRAKSPPDVKSLLDI